MIKHIRLLRNIGQFESVSTGADIPLARLTLFYSENGRGKTTIAAVLRSLASGDHVPIAERKRLTAQHLPHVVLDCSGEPPPAVFENNRWNRTLSNLVVFDDVFVDQNVYSGLAVEPGHRKNLHELILGAEAVALGRRHQDCVKKIEEHNKLLRTKERLIPAAVRASYSVDDFCELDARMDIDNAVQNVERALAAAQKQDVIRTQKSFDSLRLPAFDLELIKQLLRQDLPALDTATLDQVQMHLDELGQGGESWVSDGMLRISQGQDSTRTQVCPFCTQDLGESTLVAHYRAYFSSAYTSLKRTMSDAVEAVQRIHGGNVPAEFERAVRLTIEQRQFWSQFCGIGEITLDTEPIVRDWEGAREAVIAQLSAKQAAPLDPMEISEETRELVATFEAHQDTINTINERLDRGNIEIAKAKERVATVDAAGLADDLARLKATKARHEPEIAAACDAYLKERIAKESTERQRDQARDALDNHRGKVFPEHKTAINHYLQKFTAGFRLGQFTSANTRGGATCMYSVRINNAQVSIGKANPEPEQASFRNTLSAGDRNTLALAFFFASLDQDENLKNKIIVIDDPISSLDEHRTITTVQEIRRFAERAAQVIVLSHKKPFLCQIWDGASRDARAALRLVRDGEGSTLSAWDIVQEFLTDHDHRDARLHDFLGSGTGDLEKVAQSIRLHIEGFLRVAYPKWFKPKMSLRKFRDLCQQHQEEPGQILRIQDSQELSEIIEYANMFHHDTNSACEEALAAINDAQLRGFVERTLKFCQR